MTRLTHEQFSFLKSLSKTSSFNCSTASKPELDIIVFLDEHGFINSERETIQLYNPNNERPLFGFGEYLSISISENGKSKLLELKIDSNRYKIPLIINFIISAAALVISVITLIN